MRRCADVASDVLIENMFACVSLCIVVVLRYVATVVVCIFYLMCASVTLCMCFDVCVKVNILKQCLRYTICIIIIIMSYI